MMKALSLTQPWATLITIGAKRIETRSWCTQYRGQIAIHAAKRFPPEARDLCLREHFHPALMRGVVAQRSIWEKGESIWQMLPTSAIIAVADLTEVESMDDLGFKAPAEPEHSFGGYGPGRFAWHLANVRKLITPIPCKGALSLWEVPADVEAQIRSQLGYTLAA